MHSFPIVQRALLLLPLLLLAGCGGEKRAPASATSSGALVEVLRAGRGDAPLHLALRYRIDLATGETVASNHAGLEGPLFTTAGAAAPPVPGGALLREGLEGMRPGEVRRVRMPVQAGTGLNVEVVWTVEALEQGDVVVVRSGDGRGRQARFGSRLQLRILGHAAGAAEAFLDAKDVTNLRLTRDEGLIEGLVRGLLGARAGERLTLEIPASLGYGRVGRPPRVPPDADLHLEVEVLEVDA